MLSCGGDELTLMPNAEGEEGCREGRKVGLPGEGFKIGRKDYQVRDLRLGMTDINLIRTLFDVRVVLDSFPRSDLRGGPWITTMSCLQHEMKELR